MSDVARLAGSLPWTGQPRKKVRRKVLGQIVDTTLAKKRLYDLLDQDLACVIAPNLFSDKTKYDQAKTICRECSALAKCQALALESRDLSSYVLAGMTLRERKAWLKKIDKTGKIFDGPWGSSLDRANLLQRSADSHE